MSPSTNKTLLAHHRQQLEASGLTAETIEAAGIYSGQSYPALAHMLNWHKYPPKHGPAIVFPYRDPDGTLNGYRKVKPDNPRRRGKKPVKYEAPRGERIRAYLPPDTCRVLDEGCRIFVTEGEKKALCLTQSGFHAIGLSGVDGGFKPQSAALLPELESANWDRDVYIVFDSDIAENPQIQLAESKLAAALTARGATVQCVRIPDIGEKKCGADDFIVANGTGTFERLLRDSVEPEPIDAGDFRPDARVADPFAEADAILASYFDHPDRSKLLWSRQQFWRWNGCNWLNLPEPELSADVGTFLNTRFRKVTKSAVANVVGALKSRAMLPGDRQIPSWLDGRESGPVLAVKSGLVDLNSAADGITDKCLIPHTPLWFNAAALGYEFDSTADCPTWKRVLRDNLEGDVERIRIVQEFFGYCLVPGLDHHRFLVLEGDGSNGKSVVLAGLTAMLGRANVSSVPLHRLTDRFSPAETLSKLANVSAETDKTSKAIEHRLKELTSGDPCLFERKFAQPITALPTAKLIFACNERPHFRDRSSGLWRRMILVPFRRQVPPDEVVRGMDTVAWWEAKGELPGILNWAIEGLRRLREQGFTTSRVCQEAVRSYEDECNPVRAWIRDTFRYVAGSRILKADVFRKYQQWIEETGNEPLNLASLTKEIRRVFGNVVPKRVRSGKAGREQIYLHLAEAT